MNAGHTNVVYFGQGPFYTPVDVLRNGMMTDNGWMDYPKAIARIRRSRGISQSKLAEMLNVEQPTVQRWESGKRIPGADTMVDLGKALGVSPAEFFMDEAQVPLGPKLFIKGCAATGAWMPATEWPEAQWQTFTGAAGVVADIGMRFGLRIEGDGANLLFKEGTVIECVSHYGNAEIANGKPVVVVRERQDGMFEVSVRELSIAEDGTRWLVGKSTNPAYQRPINLDNDDEDGIVETRIAAVVVAETRLVP